MKSLEFENTQGINMQYATATVVERGFAWLIDAVVFGVYVFIMAIIIQPETDGEGMFFTIGILIPPFFFYTLLMEWLNDGRSLGKMALGLKVVRVDGRPVQVYDYLMRWLLRWLDIYLSSGAIASLTVSSTPRAQRIGDMLADTTVIQTRSGRISLQRVLKLGNLSKYKPKFPQVVTLDEQQMMLVKDVLSRSKRVKSEGNQKAVVELAHRLRLILDIDSEVNDRQFLETLVKDYITLSR